MCTSSFDREDAILRVLVNEEDQYSLWPSENSIPRGRTATGVHGDEKTYLDYVSKVWTDMRPRSLQTHIAQQASRD